MIPEGWETYKLTDFGELHNSRRVPLNSRQRESKKGIYPYYGASGIFDYIDDYIFEGEHILISEDGENLRTRQTPIAFKVDGKFWVNNHAHIFKARQNWLNDYIVYYFQNTDLSPYITGAVQPKLNKENLLAIPIHYPGDYNGERITSILSSLDDKIELNLQMNKTLEAIAQTIFKEWFVDFRFPGYDGVLVDGLPKGWRIGTIADLLTISKNTISPSVFPQQEFQHYSIPAFDEGKSPVMEQGKTILSNKFVVKKNSILISKLNPRFPRIWPVKDIDEERCVCSTEFLVLQPKKVNNYSFIISFLNLSSTMSSIAGLVTGTSSSHQRIRPNDLLSLILTLPNIDVMDEYERTVSEIIERCIRNIDENQTLTQLRDTLLPKLMTGKIRVA